MEQRRVLAVPRLEVLGQALVLVEPLSWRPWPQA